ncbi:hypothetical protein SOVF_081940 [Spinacia oleracea]|nr:hypothetical protein SOVF_081940 [Spinacia oleracea]
MAPPKQDYSPIRSRRLRRDNIDDGSSSEVEVEELENYKPTLKGTKGYFDLEDIAEEDVYSLDVSSTSEQFYMDFMVFICGVRAKVSQELNRCLLERFKQKYKVGEASSYEPRLYLVAVLAQGKWKRVKDFEKHTHLIFPKSKELFFDSSYPDDIPNEMGFWILANSIIDLHRQSVPEKTKSAFFNMCVLVTECARFDVLLFLVANTLQTSVWSHINVYLDEDQLNLIRGWSTLCVLWLLYDLGYGWNPLGVKKLGVGNELEGHKALAVLFTPEHFLEEMGTINGLIKDLQKKGKCVLHLQRRKIGTPSD